jgi:hypothetical protein
LRANREGEDIDIGGGGDVACLQNIGDNFLGDDVNTGDLDTAATAQGMILNVQ